MTNRSSFRFVSVGFLVFVTSLAGSFQIHASPDGPVSIASGAALFQGNQSNGVVSGVDFQINQVSTLEVNSLSGPIQSVSTVSGIQLQNSGARDATIFAGVGSNHVVIHATRAAGISAGSVGSSPLFPVRDDFLSIPVPTNSAVPGGVVLVQSHSDITTDGHNAAGIAATSQTTGYSPLVVWELLGYTGSGITFTVVGVTNADGTAAAAGTPVTGTLVDTNGNPIAGPGGTFIIHTNGTFSFDAGTNYSGLAVGETVQSAVQYVVHGVNGNGITRDSVGTVLATIAMTTNGLVTKCGAYFDTYGPSANPASALPDLASYGRSLAATASVGGDGNSVTVNSHGGILTRGTNSAGVLAQSVGGNGGLGSGGSISTSAGAGSSGRTGGEVTVTAHGSLTTISNGSAGILAWSQGGVGGQGGDGGFWRYGGPGGSGGMGGAVGVEGNATVFTLGDYAIGIFAVSAGGDGGGGGTSDEVFTGGGNGGNGGQGGEVTVGGDWNILTRGDYSYGIWAKSVGGNAGTGGSGGWISGHPGNGGQATDGGLVTVTSGGIIETFGHDASGIYAESVGGFGGQGGGQAGIFYSHGGDGNSAGSGGEVIVSQVEGGWIITHGTNSHGIFAQSIGGGGGSGGGAGAIVGVGGTGGSGGNGRNAWVTNSGEIRTFGEYSRGIYVQSIGGGGGDGAGSGGLVGIGGSGSGVSYGGMVSVFNQGGILTSNANSDGILAQSIGGGGGSAGASGGLVTIGGSGSGGGSASNVNLVNLGEIRTYGTNSRGIFIQSIGGGGGSGAGTGGLVSIGAGSASAGNGGTVTLTNSGSIITSGRLSTAIEVQSIGGGGGSGAGSGGLVSIGGRGSSGGNGAAVTVANFGSLSTTGDYSRGIYLQSIGGGGGDGAGSGGLVSVGGSGSGGGNGGVVALTNSGAITTSGSDADAIFAESIGRGGGSGAGSGGWLASIGGSGGGSGNGDRVRVANSGALFTAGTNSCGIFAQSVGGGGGQGAGSGGFIFSMGGDGDGGGSGGAVLVGNTGTITTLSNWSEAIFAQSVGGGGGKGRGSGAWTVSLGGDGAGGGDGGLVQVFNSGTLATYGTNAFGIFAQSVGGGGGSGAGSGAFTVSLGGDGGASGNGGEVNVTNRGAITTHGSGSSAILAQSVGGGGGSANSSGAAVFSLGGDGEGGGHGSNVTVISSQQLQAFGGDSAGILAQSVGGKGGHGGNVVNVSVGANIGISIGIGGAGGDGGNGGAVVVGSDSDIFTSGRNGQGIVAQSIGGGGGSGGNSFVLSAVANVIEAIPIAVNVAVSVGGSGGRGGDGGAVAVASSGNVITSNALSAGILAQSVGGGGGNGGNSTAVTLSYNCDVSGTVAVGGAGGVAGNGNTVGVTNQGVIQTVGNFSSGIFAQSVGGGGGLGGDSTTITGDVGIMGSAEDISPSYSFKMSMGGDGGGGGTGGQVNASSLNGVRTQGAFSYGILAQSVGGGGGAGGNASLYEIELSNTPESLAPALSLLSFGSTFVLGGNGGVGGSAANVTVNNASNVWTEGAFSVGILAQSVGGGGGAGGNVLTFEFSSGDLPVDPPYQDLLDGLTQFTSTMMVTNGAGGAGGNGGAVAVTNSSRIETHGAFAHGIFAQSVGGGGGFSGISDELDIASILFGSGTQAQGEATQSSGSGVSFAGSVGGNGSGGDVTVVHTGDILTLGNNAHAIYAQSAGGQLSGGSVRVMVDGNVVAQGTNSDAIRVQSVGAAGGGDLSVAVVGGTVQGGEGASAGVRLLGGANNTLVNHGAITTLDGADGIVTIGGTGNETIDNHGFILGAVDLGPGINTFNNFTGAVFHSGARVDLGSGNALMNAGTMAPGGNLTLSPTALNGDYVQTGTGWLVVDLASASASDRLLATGGAQLDGGLALASVNGFVPKKRDQWTVLTADQGVTGEFATLEDPFKGVYAIQLRISYTGTSVQVQTLQDSFLTFAHTANQVAVSRSLDSFSGFTGGAEDPRGAALLERLNALAGTFLTRALDVLAPEELGAMFDSSFASAQANTANVRNRVAGIRSGAFTSQASLSIYDPQHRLLANNGELSAAMLARADEEQTPAPGEWAAFAVGNGELIDVESTANAAGYDIRSVGLTFGMDRRLSERLAVGVLGAYVNTKAQLVDDGEVKLNGGKLGAYAAWHNGGAYADAIIAGGYNHFDTSRAALLGMASADADGWELQTALGGGYDFEWGRCLLGPIASLEYAREDVNSFVETGSSAPLAVSDLSGESLVSRLGIHMGCPFNANSTKLLPGVSLMWQHESLDASHEISARFASGAGGIFTVNSPALGRDSLQATASLGIQWTETFATQCFYIGQFGRDNYSAHNLGLGLKFEF